MNKTKPASADKFKLALRMETVRSDERGSVTLLAGMMVFLATIFTILAFDTNQAIYDRIVAQDAVDSAADSAALWQARFCNIEQQLNNLHYTVDEALCIAEGVSTVMCGVAVPLEAIKDIPFCEWAYGAWIPACVMCDLLPVEDAAQHLFYNVLVGNSYSIQEDIADVAPFLVFANANACAYASGANNVFVASTEWIGAGLGYIPGVGSDLSSLINGTNGLSSIISSTIGQIPIYAFPLDPTRLQLYVNPTNNESLPEAWTPDSPGAVPIAGDALGDVGCAEAFYEEVCEAVDYNPGDGDDSRQGEQSGSSGSSDNSQFFPPWGWNDQYEYGNPGFMTWVAGVTNRPELLGLGNLVWIDSTNSTVPTGMYTGSATGSGSLTIPAYMAIASSQVEGTTVVENGDVNAVNTLIPVYFSTNSPGSSYFIYH
jgi:hypothetical protein